MRNILDNFSDVLGEKTQTKSKRIVEFEKKMLHPDFVCFKRLGIRKHSNCVYKYVSEYA